MFGPPIRLFRLFNINVTVNRSFILIMILFALTSTRGPEGFFLGILLGLAQFFLLFTSVLVHEFGHSLVAKKKGYRVNEIELHFFGGAAKMLDMPRTPRDEIVIAAAGPLVSLFLALFFGSLSIFVFSGALVFSGFFGVAFDVLGQGVLFLGIANGMLCIFNLLPALPMDGGRILRAALSNRYGALRATQISVKISKGFAIAIGIFGLIQIQIFLIAIAFFLWFLASRELKIARMMHGMSSGAQVYDQYGRPVEMSPGQPFASSPSSYSTWSEAPSDMSQYQTGGVQKITIVRGPDGRMWVVTQR